jgi:nucleoporin NUP82
LTPLRFICREFDVSNDVEEPVQTVSLLPSTPSTVKQAGSTPSYSKSRSRSKAYSSRSHSHTAHAARSTRSTSRFALDNDDDDDGENSEDDYVYDEQTPPRTRSISGTHAVAFTFGIDERISEDQQGLKSSSSADWNALTIYTLCGNGDVYALCPFMPENA